MRVTLLPRHLAGLAAVAAATAAIAGCGGTSTSAGTPAGADPAAVLPASAPIYLEARIHPAGRQRADAEAVGRRLLGGRDPGRVLIALVDRQLRKDGESWRRDVAPWIGDRAGLAITRLQRRGDAVVALDATDDARAQAFLDRERGTVGRQYRGVQYRLRLDGDDAAALLDGRVVIGSERGVKAAIDADQGESLAEVDQFRQAREAVGADGLGFAYVDPRRTLDGVALDASGRGGAQRAEVVKSLLASTGLSALALSVDARRDALVGDAALVGTAASAPHGDSAAAAARAPARAWLSLGIGDAGGAVQRALARWSGAGADPQALLDQLRAGLGLDVRRDLLSWMGDATLFVDGTTRATLRGALVVRSTDPAASRRAIGLLRRALPRLGIRARRARDLPAGAQGLRLPSTGAAGGTEIAARGDRFAIAVGRGAMADALAPGRTVGATPAFRRAAALLDGARPSLFLDTPQALRLARALAGHHGGVRQVAGVLGALGPAAAGGIAEHGTRHVKLAVAVP